MRCGKVRRIERTLGMVDIRNLNVEVSVWTQYLADISEDLSRIFQMFECVEESDQIKRLGMEGAFLKEHGTDLREIVVLPRDLTHVFGRLHTMAIPASSNEEGEERTGIAPDV